MKQQHLQYMKRDPHYEQHILSKWTDQTQILRLASELVSNNKKMFPSHGEEVSWHGLEGLGGVFNIQQGLLILAGLNDLAQSQAWTVLRMSMLMQGQYMACLTRHLEASASWQLSCKRAKMERWPHKHHTEWGPHLSGSLSSCQIDDLVVVKIVLFFYSFLLIWVYREHLAWLPWGNLIICLNSKWPL